MTITLNFKSPRCWRKKLINTNAIFNVHFATLNVRKMFSVPESTAFCMLWRTPLLLLPTNSFSVTSKLRHHPPNTSIMILHCFTSYPWYFCFNFQRSGSYFMVFSSFFFFRFVTHGQLILSVITRFDSWLIMCASTLLVLTSWSSTKKGTTQNACALIASYTGFGFSGENEGGTESTRPRSCRTSKKSIFRAALCRVTYLFCARAVQPAKTWATLLGALLHSLHITSPVVSVCVFWQAYSLVDDNCS